MLTYVINSLALMCCLIVWRLYDKEPLTTVLEYQIFGGTHCSENVFIWHFIKWESPLNGTSSSHTVVLTLMTQKMGHQWLIQCFRAKEKKVPFLLVATALHWTHGWFVGHRLDFSP